MPTLRALYVGRTIAGCSHPPLVVILAIVLVFTFWADAARADAKAADGDVLDSSEVVVPTSRSNHQNGSVTYCEDRWDDDSPNARSVRLRYELTAVSRGWLEAHCSDPNEGPNPEESLTVLGKQMYGVIPDVDADSDGQEVRAPILAYAQAPTDQNQSLADKSFSLLATPDVPTLHFDKSSERTTIWVPRHHCGSIKLVLVYERTGASCRTDLRRTAKIVEQAATIDYGKVGINPHPANIDLGNEAAAAAATRTARLEWLAPSGSLEYCSGVMLTRSILLTARHCVDNSDDPAHEQQSCLRNPMYCQSYEADADFTPQGRVASLPIRAVVGPPPEKQDSPSSDYALLFLFPNANLPDYGTMAPLTRLGPSLSNTEPLYLFGYPMGYYIQATAACQIFWPDLRAPASESTASDTARVVKNSPFDDWVYHTCYTLRANSGSGLWTHAHGSLVPIAIHSNNIRNCDNPNAVDWARAQETYKSEPWLAEYTSDSSDLKSKCLGRAVQIAQVLCDRCYVHNTPDCKILKRQFQGNPLNTCGSSVSP